MDILFVATVALITSDGAKTRDLLVGSLGLPLAGHATDDEYVFSEKIGGCKHFGAARPRPRTARDPKRAVGADRMPRAHERGRDRRHLVRSLAPRGRRLKQPSYETLSPTTPGRASRTLREGRPG